MAVTNKQRLDLIEEYLHEHRYADLHTLAQRFTISVSTVRRALNELEQRGSIRRHHGGASLVEEDAGRGYDFITQDSRQSEEKSAIAETVANQIEPGMTVMIDGGTSTYSVARRIVAKRLVIITNSLPIAVLFSDVGSCETIVTGGTVYSRLGVLLGPTCDKALREMHADLAIMGSAGMTEEGLWNTNSLIVSTQRQMLEASDRAIYCLDSSKFGRRALTLTTEHKPGIDVVSEKKPEASLLRAMESAGGSFHQAK